MLLLLPGLAGCASALARPTPTATADPAVAGGRLFELNCAECHGPAGEGHAIPSAPALDSTEHAFHHPDWELRQFITNGKVSFGPVDMPAFGDKLSEQEIGLVIAYLKSLWTEGARQFQESVNQRLVLPTATP